MASTRQAPRLFPHSSELPVAVRGEGIRIWDEAGREYLDACAGAISVISIGHGVGEVADAMAEQARTLAYVQSTQFGHLRSRELAARIAELAPGSLNRAIFYSGGSEAVEAAVKLARHYHLLRGRGSKHLVLSRRRSYHGATLFTLGMGGVVSRQLPYQPYLSTTPKQVECNPYRCPFGNGSPVLRPRLRRRPRARDRRGRRGLRLLLLRRADRRRSRARPDPAPRLLRARSRDLPRQRHPLRVRRDRHRLGAHGTHVRHRALGRRAGHDRQRERTRRRLHAALHGDLLGRRGGRLRGRRNAVRPQHHLRGASGRRSCGAHGAGHHRARRPRRERGRSGRAPAGPAGRPGRATAVDRRRARRRGCSQPSSSSPTVPRGPRCRPSSASPRSCIAWPASAAC